MNKTLRLEATINASTQFATVYNSDTGKPVATLQRSRVYAPAGTPRWSAYDLNGRAIRHWFSPIHSGEYLLRSLANTMARNA